MDQKAKTQTSLSLENHYCLYLHATVHLVHDVSYVDGALCGCSGCLQYWREHELALNQAEYISMQPPQLLPAPHLDLYKYQCLNIT